MTPKNQRPYREISVPWVVFVCVMVALIGYYADQNGRKAMGIREPNTVVVPLAGPVVGVGRGYISEGWTITHYCNCKVCTNKTPSDKGYGITASRVKAKEGTVVCNWLLFGTKIIIDDKTYIVQDRGSKKLFGDKKNHIKRLDIWCSSHREALKKGIKKGVTINIKKESL